MVKQDTQPAPSPMEPDPRADFHVVARKQAWHDWLRKSGLAATVGIRSSFHAGWNACRQHGVEAQRQAAAVQAAQAAEIAAVRNALEAARHALVTLQGLTGLDLDPWDYELLDGLDFNAAMDLIREHSHMLNDSALLARIDVVLGPPKGAVQPPLGEPERHEDGCRARPAGGQQDD